MGNDVLRCKQIVRGKACREILLQLVEIGSGRAMLLCPECHHKEVVHRRPPPPPIRWRSPTLSKPCAMPDCPGIVIVPVSHPTRAMFCGRHTRAERRRVSVRCIAALGRLKSAIEESK